MLRVLALTILILLAVAAFWFSQSSSPPSTTSTAQQTNQTSAAKKPDILDHKGTPIPAETKALAITHIDTITPPEKTPLNVSKAQHFVTAEQILQLPRPQSQQSTGLEPTQDILLPPEPTTSGNNATDAAVASQNRPVDAPNAPGTVAAQQDEQTPALVEQPTSGATVNAPEQPAIAVEQPVTTAITITRGVNAPTNGSAVSTPQSVTIRAVKDAGLTVQPLTATATENSQGSAEITENFAAQTTEALLPDSGRQIRLKELLDHPEQAEGKIFYLHAVHPDDNQGLWGIIQNALINSFAEGLNLPGGEQAARAMIPQDADERLQDQRSSFLGHILQRKVEESYVYSYEKGMVGQNPDLIQPGQQLVIITFTEEELVQIYQFFTGESEEL